MMGKISEISKKTADAAWEWAEANQDSDPLADAYVGACAAIGMCMCNRVSVAARLGITVAAMSAIDAHAFEYRNALARRIVKMLKRELPNVEHDRRTAALSPGVRVDGPVGPHTQEK